MIDVVLSVIVFVIVVFGGNALVAWAVGVEPIIVLFWRAIKDCEH